MSRLSNLPAALMEGLVDAVPEQVGILISKGPLQVTQDDLDQDVLLPGSKA